MNGKYTILNQLKEEAEELRSWMMAHSSPDTSAAEFERYANRYAIVMTKMYIVEKQW